MHITANMDQITDLELLEMVNGTRRVTKHTSGAIILIRKNIQKLRRPTAVNQPEKD